MFCPKALCDYAFVFSYWWIISTWIMYLYVYARKSKDCWTLCLFQHATQFLFGWKFFFFWQRLKSIFKSKESQKKLITIFGNLKSINLISNLLNTTTIFCMYYNTSICLVNLHQSNERFVYLFKYSFLASKHIQRNLKIVMLNF